VHSPDREPSKDCERAGKPKGGGDRRIELREGLRPTTAVLVDAVAGDVDGTGVDGRVAVVAVSRAREAVSVTIEIDRDHAVAVLVDRVVEDLRHTRIDGGVRIVAVEVGLIAIAVRVTLEMLSVAAKTSVAILVLRTAPSTGCLIEALGRVVSTYQVHVAGVGSEKEPLTA
jgi:hypothetical protein